MGRIIIVANEATNKKVNVTSLFILTIIITAKDGFRYIFYVLIEVKFIQGMETRVSIFENINEYTDSGVNDCNRVVVFSIEPFHRKKAENH